MGKEFFQDESLFLLAWETRDPALSRKALSEPSLSDAAEAVRKVLADEGFGLYRNGGLPLLERCVDMLRQEIVFHTSPLAIPGVFEPLALKVHLSHEGLRDVRARYWTKSASGSLISGNLGLIDNPPGWVIWDVADGRLQEFASWVASVSTSWLDRFEDLDALAGDALFTRVPLVSTADVLELMLAEDNKDRAKRFLREIAEFGTPLAPRGAALTRIDARATNLARLDAIATSYRLR